MAKRAAKADCLPEVPAEGNGGIGLAEGQDGGHWRIHHHVSWDNCAAKIVSAKWQKKCKGRR